MAKSYLHEAFEAAAGLNPLHNPKPKEDPFLDADQAEFNQSEKYQTAYAKDKKDDDFELSRKERRKKKDAQSQSILKVSCLSACSVNIGGLKMSGEDYLNTLKDEIDRLGEKVDDLNTQEEEITQQIAELDYNAEEAMVCTMQRISTINDNEYVMTGYWGQDQNGETLTSFYDLKTPEDQLMLENIRKETGLELELEDLGALTYGDVQTIRENLSPYSPLRQQFETFVENSDGRLLVNLADSQEDALYLQENFGDQVRMGNMQLATVRIGSDGNEQSALDKSQPILPADAEDLQKLEDLMLQKLENGDYKDTAERERLVKLRDSVREKRESVEQSLENVKIEAKCVQEYAARNPGEEYIPGEAGYQAVYNQQAIKAAQTGQNLEAALQDVPDKFKDSFAELYNEETADMKAQGIEPEKATAEEDLVAKQAQTVTIAPGGM